MGVGSHGTFELINCTSALRHKAFAMKNNTGRLWLSPYTLGVLTGLASSWFDQKGASIHQRNKLPKHLALRFTLPLIRSIACRLLPGFAAPALLATWSAFCARWKASTVVPIGSRLRPTHLDRRGHAKTNTQARDGVLSLN